MTATATATAEAGIPDALFVPEKLKRGATLYERMNSVLALAEPMLGVDRARGDRAYIRRQGDGWLFVTRDPGDTIAGPTHSPMRGRPRYDWVEGQGGIRLGYLKDEFRGVDFGPFDPIALGLVRPGGF